MERKEIKLRQRWRRRADSCRPARLKGAANRGGGSKRRGPERAVGHKGGAMARAVQREAGDVSGKHRRKKKRCDFSYILRQAFDSFLVAFGLIFGRIWQDEGGSCSAPQGGEQR